MKEDSERITGIFTRYIFILLLGLGNLYVFYKVLTPLTLSVLGAVLSGFWEVTITGTSIYLSSVIIEIVPACVAGAAFYLLFILVFSTANLKPKKRLSLLVISFVALFVLNILRMLFLIAIIDKPFFGTVHWVLWNLVSTLFVIVIWLAVVRMYRIKAIPIYSDLRYMIDLVKDSRKKAKRN